MKIQAGPAAIGAPVIAGWALSRDGNPVVRFVASGVDVMIELSPEDARNVCVDGCAAFVMAMQARQGNGLPKGVASRLVGVDGLPIVGKS